jgi:hypothetical protein
MHVHDHAGHAAPPLLSIVDHPGHRVNNVPHTLLSLPDPALDNIVHQTRQERDAQTCQ